MQSTVYFIDLRTRYKDNLPTKLARLLDMAGLSDVVGKNDLAAVKLHFGEQGNTAFIRPVFLRRIVELIKALGGVPFLTDSNTLYAGTRSDSPRHLQTAIQNGFAYSVVNAPVIIADGLRGRSETAVPISGKRFDTVYIGTDIAAADVLIGVAHFKGHELTGFAGAIKNLGMGCASRRGKLAQHSSVVPKVKNRRCTGCGDCAGHCSQNAISIVNEKARIDPEKCIGCGECILLCRTGAIQVQWNRSIPVFMENMVEYTMGVLKSKKGKSLFINFITDISPACDCLPFNDAPIVQSIGIAASIDPVALDQACVDLVNKEPALPGSCLKENKGPGEDKFKGVYPKIDWTLQLEYAQSLGLGSRSYKLEKV